MNKDKSLKVILIHIDKIYKIDLENWFDNIEIETKEIIVNFEEEFKIWDYSCEIL